MTAKGMRYYLEFDLDHAAVEMTRMGFPRHSNEVFADAIQAIVLQAKARALFVTDVVRVLGQPERIVRYSTGDVLEYHWSDRYGSTEYSSVTPILTRNGRVIGLAE